MSEIKTITVKSNKVELPDDPTNEDIRLATGEYCPYCCRVIYPENVDDVMLGIANGFIYVHDEVIHDEDFTFGVMH